MRGTKTCVQKLNLICINHFVASLTHLNSTCVHFKKQRVLHHFSELCHILTDQECFHFANKRHHMRTLSQSAWELACMANNTFVLFSKLQGLCKCCSLFIMDYSLLSCLESSCSSFCLAGTISVQY